MNAPITVGVDEVLAPGGFEIDNEERASWAVSVIRARRRHLADLEEQHAVRIAKAARELAHAEAVLMPQLEAYARAEIKRSRVPTRHVDVATGRLQLRSRPPGWKVTDDAKVLAFARSLKPEAIRRQVLEGIDLERVKHGAAMLFTKTTAEELEALLKSHPHLDGNSTLDVADARARAKLAEAGIEMVAAGETFHVGSGSDNG